MKISNVKAVVTENDVMGIIEEFVKIKELNIEDIKINELITIKGSYKKGINIPFVATVGLGNINDNFLNLKLFDVKVSKVGLFSGVKNMVLKKIVSEFEDYGISVDKDNITLQIDIISKFVPYVYFKAKKVTTIEGALEVEIEELIYSQNKETAVVDKKEAEVTQKISDKYAKTRKEIVQKVPDKYKKLVEYAMLIPDVVALLWRLFKDKRVPFKVKIMVGGMLAFLVSPIDILPDFIPFIGKIDDIAVTFFGLNAIINEVDEKIILENWQGEQNIILVVKEAVKYISNAVGSQNVGKLIDAVKNILSKGKVQKVETPKVDKNTIEVHKKEEGDWVINEEGNNIH